MRFKDIKIGAEVRTSHVTRGEIVSRVEKSHTKIVIVDTDRGKGWDEETKSYKGIKHAHGWERGENFCYGQEHVYHIKDVELLN